VEITPLYRGVHLIRGLTTGVIEPMLLFDCVYLFVLGSIGMSITARRLDKLLTK
jgi:lipooligosaccharide transport system permease protein